MKKCASSAALISVKAGTVYRKFGQGVSHTPARPAWTVKRCWAGDHTIAGLLTCGSSSREARSCSFVKRRATTPCTVGSVAARSATRHRFARDMCTFSLPCLEQAVTLGQRHVRLPAEAGFPCMQGLVRFQVKWSAVVEFHGRVDCCHESIRLSVNFRTRAFSGNQLGFCQSLRVEVQT